MPLPSSPALTVDAVIADHSRGVVLIRRRNDPFAGSWALPGGFVDVGESCQAACRREAAEETGLDVETVSLIGEYSRAGRDPRCHTVSLVYLCRVVGGSLEGGDDAAEAAWFADLTGIPLAFDHADILSDAGFVPRPPSVRR